MSAIRFFNFGNQQTYHFFQWVVHSKQVDYERLIARAFEQVAASAFMEMDLATAHLLKKQLEQLLRESLEKVKKSWFDKHKLNWQRYTIQECATNDDYAEADALFVALLEHAAERIAFDTAAEALLRKTGNWLHEE